MRRNRQTQTKTSPAACPPQVAFSEFVKQVQKNEVQRVVIDSASNSFTFTLRPSSPLYKMLPGGCRCALPCGRRCCRWVCADADAAL